MRDVFGPAQEETPPLRRYRRDPHCGCFQFGLSEWDPSLRRRLHRSVRRSEPIGPVHRCEDLARALIIGDADREHGRAMRTFHAGESAIDEMHSRGIGGMDVKQRLALVRHQPQRSPAACHRMPLVARTPRIQKYGPTLIGHHRRRSIRCRHETRPAVRGGKPCSISKQPLGARPGLRGASWQRPMDGGSRSYSSSLRSQSAPMSKMRRCGSAFSNADKAACSRKISAGPR